MLMHIRRRRILIAALVGAGLAALGITVTSSNATRTEARRPNESRAQAPWKVLMTTNREGDSEIYSINADGSGGTRRLTRSAGVDAFGSWSPNRRRIAFYSQRRLGGDVWVMNADGTGQRDLTRNPAHDSNTAQAWSPDGRRIAFDSDRDGNGEIYVMNADGSGQRNVSQDASAQDAQPAWSPDGRRIAFVTDRDGNWEIYSMNADGSDPQNLTQNRFKDGRDFGFIWSPDGRTIAFTSNRDASRRTDADLYLMNADGSNVRRLTRGLGFEAPLSWSPEGRKLAFSRPESARPRWAFFVVNADGTGARQVNWALPRKG